MNERATTRVNPYAVDNAERTDGLESGESVMSFIRAATYGVFVPVAEGGFRPATPEVSGLESSTNDLVTAAIGGIATAQNMFHIPPR